MPALKQLRYQLHAIPNPPDYAYQCAKTILERVALSPEEASGLLEEYGRRYAQALASFAYSDLPSAVNWLDQQARQAAIRRPAPEREDALLVTFHNRCNAAGWVSEEANALKAKVKPSEVISVDWRAAQTTTGEIDRAALRESMRSAAYDDDGWRRYLASLPPIEVPEKNLKFY